MTQELKFDHPNFIHVSKEAKDLISKMLDRNVESRISSNQILKHSWSKFFAENEETFSHPHEIAEKKEI
jgi:serine/threonine protein kinase